MDKKRFGKNNKGASLILVVGCVALLSVIGSMLLLITANNREMKELEKQMQNTFYQAESGSDEMVSALEAEAEEILTNAFSEMLIHFSEFSDDTQREARIAEYFREALIARLNEPGVASSLMGDAVTATSVDVTIPDGSVTYTASTASNKSDTIKISGAQFSYTDDKGNETVITTDICIQSGIPNVTDGLTSDGVRSDFTDFALITNGDVSLNTGMGDLSKALINGNMYSAGSINVTADATIEINNADKVLVKKDISVKEGKVKIDNSGKISSGHGVWADGLKVLEGGTIEGTSNFYISDDLTVEDVAESGGKVVLGGSGAEYVGFSGNSSSDPSKNSSAITINNAKNITIDLSGMNNLILNGTSYIYDKKWTTGTPILQGESLAFKDMQTMYLVPGSIINGYNPMLSGDYRGPYVMTEETLKYYYDPADASKYLNLSEYVDVADPFITRNVVLDGGATEFTYLYLKFTSPAKAAQYFNDYMATSLGDDIRARIENLGTASVIKPAQNNYTMGAVMEYVGNVLTFENMTGSGATLRSYSASTAKKRQKSLFTSFRLNGGGSVGDDWTAVNVIENTILSEDALSLITNTSDAPTGDGLWVHRGDVTLNGVRMNGIIVVVDGKLTIDGSNGRIEGLVIATGGVEIRNNTELIANKDVVDNLLLDPDVAKYFRVGSSADSSSDFVSSEAIAVKFENWQRN